jgi:PAS domain S-box-containing protein
VLKVDRSFVSSMIQNRDSRKIVAAVVGLGQSLKLTTVAEGIENATQADILRWLGCDIGQGWIYGPPVSKEDLPQVVAAPIPTVLPRSFGAAASDLVAGMEPLPSQRLAQLQAIYDGVPVGLAFVDADLRCVSINQRLAEISGVPVEEHIGRKVSEVVPPMIYSKIEPSLLRALQGIATTGMELTLPIAPGSREMFTHLYSHQPARDEAGEVIGVSIVVLDITERTHMLEALRVSEDHYRHMVASSPHMPWVMEPDGRIVEASLNWQRFTGQSNQQMLQWGWKEALHPEDLCRVMAVLSNSFRNGDPIDIEYRLHAVDGSYRWMRSRGTARRNDYGQILRWYGCAEDIDEQVRLRQRLEQAEARIAELELLSEKQHLAPASR